MLGTASPRVFVIVTSLRTASDAADCATETPGEAAKLCSEDIEAGGATILVVLQDRLDKQWDRR